MKFTFPSRVLFLWCRICPFCAWPFSFQVARRCRNLLWICCCLSRVELLLPYVVRFFSMQTICCCPLPTLDTSIAMINVIMLLPVHGWRCSLFVSKFPWCWEISNRFAKNNVVVEPDSGERMADPSTRVLSLDEICRSIKSSKAGVLATRIYCWIVQVTILNARFMIC